MCGKKLAKKLFFIKERRLLLDFDSFDKMKSKNYSRLYGLVDFVQVEGQAYSLPLYLYCIYTLTVQAEFIVEGEISTGSSKKHLS